MLPRLILGIAIIIALLWFYQRYQKTPADQRRSFLLQYGLIILAILLVLLAITGRMHWVGAVFGALLPLARRGLPWVMRGLPFLAALRKEHGRSELRSRIVLLTLQHRDQSLDGKVLEGEFEGRELNGMSESELEQLASYCQQQDGYSAQVLNSYLARRFGAQHNADGQYASGQQAGGHAMDRKQALAVLGLGDDADKEAIVSAHRKLMQKLHPDRGGNDFLAAQINTAKDTLLS